MVTIEVATPLQSILSNPKKHVSGVEVAKEAWRNAWYGQFSWIEYNSKLDTKIINVVDTCIKGIYSNNRSGNIKVYVFKTIKNFKEILKIKLGSIIK